MKSSVSFLSRHAGFAEILCLGHRRQPYPQACPGGSFIWPKTRHVWFNTVSSLSPICVRLHFQPQVVALARPLTDAGKNGETTMLCRDPGNKFLNDYGLAHTCAAEQAHLAAPYKRTQQVDYFYPCLEHLGLCGKVNKSRRLYDESAFFLSVSIGPRSSIGSPSRLSTLPRVFFTHRHVSRGTSIYNFHPSANSQSAAHRNEPLSCRRPDAARLHPKGSVLPVPKLPRTSTAL